MFFWLNLTKIKKTSYIFIYFFAGCKKTEKSEELIKRYSSCPTEKKEYEISGRKYTVIRHFTGDKDINLAILELAVSRANREMGLY